MSINLFQAKYYTYTLNQRLSADNPDKLTSILVDAQVDLNPHQIDAALFAFNYAEVMEPEHVREIIKSKMEKSLLMKC